MATDFEATREYLATAPLPDLGSKEEGDEIFLCEQEINTLCFAVSFAHSFLEGFPEGHRFLKHYGKTMASVRGRLIEL